MSSRPSSTEHDTDLDTPEADPVVTAARRAHPAQQYVVDSQVDRLLWLNDIACVDASLDDFFLDAGHSIAPETLELCRSCPVRMQCIEHAYRANLTSGYFAGISPSQRRELTLDEARKIVRATTRLKPST